MKKLSKINNWSLFLLSLIFFSIFSMAGLLSIKDVQADESSQNFLRMLDIEEQLHRNKMRMNLLAQEQETYLQNNVTKPERRFARFSSMALQRTKKYHREVAAVDQEIEDDHKKWRAQTNNEHRTEGATRLEWRHTLRGRDFLAYSEKKKIALRVAYYADMKKLKKEILMGEDGFLDAMDFQREMLLMERRDLLNELEFLKTHTDAESELKRDRPEDWRKIQDFSLSVVGKTVRYIDIGNTEEVELLIGAGTMPLTLEIIAEDGSREVKRLTNRAILKLPFHFITPGNKTRLFILTDSGIPRKSRTANVTFLVRDPTAPAIQIDKTVSSSNINKGSSVTYTYKVTNPGNDPLSGIKVIDDTCSNVMFITGGDTNNDGKLDPGETWTYECSMTLNADTTNTAKASGTGTSGTKVSDQAAATVSVSTGVPTDCPPPKVEVPHVVYISESKAEEIITNNNLRFTVTKKEYSNRHEAGTLLDQFPNPGECVDPNTKVTVTVSLGQRETPSAPFDAKFDCGDSFELSPNEILYPKICHVLVRGYNDSDERVRVQVLYNNSILRVFPDDQSAPPYLMYPSTAGPHSGYYVFSINFSTTATAPPGITSVKVIVSQGGNRVVIPVTILVLEPGQEPSSGTGIRPPAEVATGSAGDSPDAYCVWRYKSFGDRPECFNFVRAECNTPRYSSSRYELVGSGMTRMESAARMAQLGSYHDDAYGCHTSTDTDDSTATGRDEIECVIDKERQSGDWSGPEQHYTCAFYNHTSGELVRLLIYSGPTDGSTFSIALQSAKDKKFGPYKSMEEAEVKAKELCEVRSMSENQSILKLLKIDWLEPQFRRSFTYKPGDTGFS